MTIGPDDLSPRVILSAADWLDSFGSRSSDDFAPHGISSMGRDDAVAMVLFAWADGWPGVMA